ncbi:inner membrane protein yqaA [Shigella dysenteriae 1617]|nr:inner membrane protein yqaA [Shigella dysenteriae 1617]EGI97088.1 inner membrane protein yqaA [Shigella boydii 3594-74]EIQ42131.1 inner membrane protein yqaA [Shigella sonnei 3233-85]
MSVSGMDAHLVGTGNLFLCLGKALRYVAVAAATVQGMMWWH